MDHAGIVVEDLAAAIAFFVELGLELEGQTTVEGAGPTLVGRTTSKRTSRFCGPGRPRPGRAVGVPRPATTTPAPNAPVNVPGIPRLTFVVDAVDDTFESLRPHGAELVGEVAQYEDIYRYGYVRGPAGVIIGLCEEL